MKIWDKVTFNWKDYFVVSNRQWRLRYRACDEFYAVYQTTTP